MSMLYSFRAMLYSFSAIRSTAITVLLLQLPQPLLLLQTHVFFLLLPAHPVTELVLSKDAINSWLLDHHPVSLPVLNVIGIVSCVFSHLYLPILKALLLRKPPASSRWWRWWRWWRWRWFARLLLLFVRPVLKNCFLFHELFFLFILTLWSSSWFVFFGFVIVLELFAFDLILFSLYFALLFLRPHLVTVALLNYWLCFCRLILFFRKDIHNCRHVLALLLILHSLHWFGSTAFYLMRCWCWFFACSSCFLCLVLFGFRRQWRDCVLVGARDVMVDFILVFVLPDFRFFLFGSR